MLLISGRFRGNHPQCLWFLRATRRRARRYQVGDRRSLAEGGW
jgi:hypothetical protein